MSLPFSIHPRLKLFCQRHVPLLIALSLLVPVHATLVRSRGGPGVCEEPGPYPLASLWVGLFESSESANSIFSMRYGVVLATSVLMSLGLWRLTRNRLVSLSAGALFLLHPLTVQMVVNGEGIVELLSAAFAAWVFCLHAGPRFRSPRFPNRRPTPFAWPTFAVCAAASLATPLAWTLPLLLIVMDLTFDRERGGAWFEREWSGYLRYAVLIPISLALQIFDQGSDAQSIFGPAQLLSPRLAIEWPVLAGLLTWPLLVVGLFCFLLDQMSNVGARRTLLRFAGFASAWFLISAIVGPILARDLPASGALTGQLAVHVGLSVLFFRVATRLDGERTAPTPARISLAWSVHGASPEPIGETEPNVEPVGASAEYEPPHSLRRALGRLQELKPLVSDGADDRCSLGAEEADQIIGDLVDQHSVVVEYSQGSSAFTSHLATRAGQLTVLSGDETKLHFIENRLCGLGGCAAMNPQHWLSLDNTQPIDLFVSAGGLPQDADLMARIVRDLAPGAAVLAAADPAQMEALGLQVDTCIPETSPQLLVGRMALPMTHTEQEPS